MGSNIICHVIGDYICKCMQLFVFEINIIRLAMVVNAIWMN